MEVKLDTSYWRRRIKLVVLLITTVSALAFFAESLRAQNRPSVVNNEVAIIGKPTWWIVPNQEGNRNEGKLYFGAVIQNRLNQAVSVGLSFQSYLEDGTRFEGCYSPGGGGPGVKELIAPLEKALLVCNRAIVRRDLRNLQVTSRLWDVHTIAKNRIAVKVVESGLIELESGLEEESLKYTAFARLQSSISQDTEARVLFRFYSDDGIQVATCVSDDLIVEPEVVLRTTCSLFIYVDTGRPQPQSVRAEILPANSW